MTHPTKPVLHGIAIALWVLTGFTFLTDALLPGVGRFHALAPWLLATSVLWTAMMPVRATPSQLQPSRIAFLLVGFALALAISFTIIRDGDRRSLLFVGFVSLVAILLSQQKKPAPRG